jgi:hypothetical protein
LLRDASHVRNYNLCEWIAALEAAGFQVDGVTRRRVRLQFASWIARTRTSPLYVEAIRALQTGAPDVVQKHFSTEADGSFTLDSVAIIANVAR